MSSSSFSLDSRSLRSLSWEECHQRSDLRSLAALVPGGSARVTAEPSHHLLKVNRRLQSLLVDRHILIPVHGFGYRLRSLMNLFFTSSDFEYAVSFTRPNASRHPTPLFLPPHSSHPPGGTESTTSLRPYPLPYPCSGQPQKACS